MLDDDQAIDMHRLLGLLALKDQRAVVPLRQLASRLSAIADELEKSAENPFQAPSGMSDRVKMQIHRPDGTTTTTDTGGSQ